eukprot:SAG11_NODE_38182_length_253_cov_1.012987_1_plen_31_part_01
MITGELPFQAKNGVRNAVCAEVVDATIPPPS